MNKNPLWKKLTKESNSKNKEDHRQAMLSPRSDHSNLEQIFKDIPVTNSNRKEEINENV